MRALGHADRWRPGLVLAWRRWQLGLVAVGVILGIVVVGGDIGTGAGARGRPAAPIAEQELGAPVWTLACAGGSLLTSTTRGDVWLKDLAAGRLLCLRDASEGFLRSAAPSPDGRFLAIADNRPEVRIWEAERGTELEPLGDGTGTVCAIAFSPDGTMLAVGKVMPPDRRGTVTVWEWPGRRSLATVQTRRACINVLAFSPDGSRLVAADPAGELTIWDPAAGELLARTRAHSSPITAMACSLDGRLVATSSFLDGTVRLWDAITAEARGALPDVSTAGASLGFSPDGAMLAIAQGDGIASLWEVGTCRQAGAVRVPSGRVQSIAFLGDGRVLATGELDGSVRLWDRALLLGSEPDRP
jgi:WD40 repeat protein